MEILNEIKFSLPSHSVNESTARAVVSSFLVQADPTVEELSDIRTAVSEAVTNAIVHGYRGSFGKVDISVKLLAGREIYIRIKDCGCGIPQDEIKNLTEPFYMVDKSRSRSEGGAGLGLSIVKMILQLHGAEMAIESTVGKGTIITLQFSCQTQSNAN